MIWHGPDLMCLLLMPVLGEKRQLRASFFGRQRPLVRVFDEAILGRLINV